jgi:hypothetical protein
MKKILIYAKDEGTRETMKLILGDMFDLILAEDFEQSLKILNGTKIGYLFVLIAERKDLKELEKFREASPNINLNVLAQNKLSVLEPDIKKLGANLFLRPFRSEEIINSLKKS